MTTKEVYQEKVEVELRKWRTEIEKLRAKADELKAGTGVEFHKQLDELTTKQKTAQQKLRELKQAGSANWQEISESLENALIVLRESINQVKQTIQEPGHKSLGWPEGQAHERPHDSEGWAEGMGHRGKSSEGWVEGMGHKGQGSKGWAEGYEQEDTPPEQKVRR